MDEQLARMERRLDAILEAQVEIRVDLAEHMRRTEVAELRLDATEKVLDKAVEVANGNAEQLKSISKWGRLGIAAILGSVASSNPQLAAIVKLILGN